MLYEAYELQRGLLAGASAWAGLGSEWMNNPANPFAHTQIGTMMASGLDVFAHASAPHGKPHFDLPTTTIDGRDVPVVEVIEARRPFGQLRHFTRPGAPAGQPKLLIVAPMSGHYATLLRGTVERMLPGHDVWITDWRDARQVSLEDGRFDLDDYIDYLVGFLEHIGPGAHVLAVCQPAVPAYAAACVMSADGNPARPRSLTMMGGPIDTREAPTTVNTVATQRPFTWFEQNVIATVPWFYPGAGRKVYPGFLQLTGFMAMNWGNHLVSHWQMFRHLVDGDQESAEGTKAFYDEYRSVCDMTAEFYLQTIDIVFQRHLLPKGEMMHRGRKVDPAALTDVALLAIEGERDDISGLGQTKAALTIATNLPDRLKKYYMAPSVGHYGIFNGRRWRTETAPILEAWIAQADGRKPARSKPAPKTVPDVPPEQADSANVA
ncbi:polyhydroxyalkanoate depolymerase [Sphingomonas nostoxanthinifaciens]|uniref:polyhydroxyalkanoate depolymerase n=1 Tax=Sphingomonas nostoxanthinifaciens TaxID=2872652 RepID=UPI001CC1F71F|nr:polyhydroxyalkanoate depolymerase [Sphingomonas nostoxanthinifaciens]UAK24626.1 polyhydroxyalkanoate depolymerase [Sphingomonas nostoxanthinifaciens]